MRILSVAVLAAVVAGPALADETSGTVVAFDRVANILVLEDKTVWHLNADLAMPENLVAGEKILIVFASAGENGVAKVESVTRSE